MGIGNISIWQLLILLLIVVLVFGTKKLRNMGSDLGSAIRDFRKGMNEEGDPTEAGSQDAAKSESAEADGATGSPESHAPKS